MRGLAFALACIALATAIAALYFGGLSWLAALVIAIAWLYAWSADVVPERPRED